MLSHKTQISLENAIASVEMEGYSLSEYEKSICAEFLDNKISKEEYIRIILERCVV